METKNYHYTCTVGPTYGTLDMMYVYDEKQDISITRDQVR